MAVAVEATGGNSVINNNGVTLASFTVTAANLMLVAISVGDDFPIGADATTVTWNTSQTLTQIGSSSADDGNWASVTWYRLYNPTAATASVAVVVNGFTPDQLAVHVVTFTGADIAGTPLGTPSTASGTSANPSVTVVDSANGDIVAAVSCNDNESGATTPANTEIFEVENLGSDTDHNSQYKTATGASTVMSWTQSGSGSGWAASGLAVKASGGGGGGSYNAIPVLEYYQQLRRGVFH